MGGGIPEARVLFCAPKQATAPSIATDLDLDRYDKGSITCIYLSRTAETYGVSTFNPIILTAPPQNGYKEVLYMYQDSMMGTSARYTKQPNGLWKIDIVYPDGDRNDNYPFMLVVGMRSAGAKSSTKTTEVSTMSINSNQPISAGNLKAALDGLTGGGRS